MRSSFFPRNSIVKQTDSKCGRKVRMSGLCKVEMSAFLGAERRPQGRGADQLEPTGKGPIARVARSRTRASAAKGSGQASAAERPAGSAVASPPTTAGGWRANAWVAGPALQPQDFRGRAAARRPTAVEP